MYSRSGMALTRYKEQYWQVPALDRRHPYWDQHISVIKYIILYDSNDAYWFYRNWLSTALRTICTGVITFETPTMCGSHCSSYWQTIIPCDQSDITGVRNIMSSPSNRSWGTFHHWILESWLSSAESIQIQKPNMYGSVEEEYHCWQTQQLFRGGWSACIQILSQWLLSPHHLSIHLAVWTTPGLGLLCCSKDTVMPFALCIFWWRIHHKWDHEVCRSRQAFLSMWNIKIFGIIVWINSPTILAAHNVWLASMLHWLITPLIQCMKFSDNLSDASECYTSSFLHTSAFQKRGSDLMICIQIMSTLWNICTISHHNMCAIYFTFLEEL